MSRDARQRDIDRARERADLARMRFGNNVQSALHRIAPERLKDDAVEAAANQFEAFKQNLAQRLRYWPVTLGAAGAGVALLIFWKPARTISRHGVRLARLAWASRFLWRRLG